MGIKLKSKINEFKKLEFARWHKLLTASLRATPDFYIAGTQKGGTTSLFKYLSQHPQFLPPSKKEIHYFEKPSNRKKGAIWYKSHFPLKYKLKSANAITGEATPFMYAYHVPRLVHELTPDAKIIFLLRNPIQRAFSHYQHNVNKHQFESLTFSEAIRLEENRIANDLKHIQHNEWYNDGDNRAFSYVNRGNYQNQIKRWEKHFKPEQILIIKSEDFFSNSQHVLSQVTDFLQIEKFSFVVDKRFNQGKYQSKITAQDETFIKQKLGLHTNNNYIKNQ